MKTFVCEFCEFEATQEEADKLGGLCPRDDGYLVEVEESKEVRHSRSNRLRVKSRDRVDESNL